MAARRTRRSSGLTSLGIMDQDQEDHLAEFDSFRRRHARQNREIITENITRKGLIRSLQDQVSSLQADLLSARRQNAALTRQLACFRDDAAALDAIIEAVPKLVRLRSALGPAPRRQRKSIHPPPRIAAAPQMGVLHEEDESRRYSEASSPFATPSPKPRRRRRRESGLFPPRLETPEPEEDAVEDAVTPRRSPEPDRQSTTPKASPRRRSPRKSKSPRASSTPTKSPRTPASNQHTPNQSSPLTPVPDTPAIASVTVSSLPSCPSAPSPSQRGSIPSCSTASIPWSSTSGVSDVLSASTAATSPQTSNQPATQPDTDPPSLASSSSSTTSTAALTSTSDAAIAAAPEDGRSRRARSSVSYKEPSLRTKMRKPDGVSSEEALGLRPRGSMLEGVRRKSALPRSTAKMDFRADKEEEGAPTPLAPAKVVKETLPKEGTKKAAGKRRAAATATTNAAGPAV